jgi:glutathione S-transferase
LSLQWFSPRRSLTITVTIAAFERSPDGGKGLARDTRVRWALEEVDQPYDVRLLSFKATKEPAHLALHPFGQIPTYEEGDLALFETGAIVFHIADCHAGLLAGRCQCPGARDHMDVCRAQHGGADDP